MTVTAAVRPGDYSTAHEAAAVAKRGTLQARVRQALHDHAAGLTDWELLRVLGEPDRRRGSVVKRRQDSGAVPVVVDGHLLTRLSPDRRPCVVWRLPDPMGDAS